MIEVCGIVLEHVNGTMIEKSVFQHLYSCHGINLRAKTDVKQPGGLCGST